MFDDDETGYGKPPVHTRFQKGRSGNPGGKPGPRKTRRQRFAQLLEARMLASPGVAVETRCNNAMAEMAMGMMIDAMRGKTAAVRTVLMLLDELDGLPTGRPRALDRRLEWAEWVDDVGNE